MQIKFQVERVCPGGCHLDIAVRVAGWAIHRFQITTLELETTPENVEQHVRGILLSFVRKSGKSFGAQLKTAIEAEVFEI